MSLRVTSTDPRLTRISRGVGRARVRRWRRHRKETRG